MRERETEHQRRNSDAGFTTIETIVAMTVFAIGILALTQVQFAAARINMNSRTTTTASMLASDRLEEVSDTRLFSAITPANFPEEAYGAISGADGRFAKYRRTVTITDTTDLAGRVSMKTITIRVFWQGLRGEQSLDIASNLSRF